MDTFSTNNISVYVFLSKTCPHCVDYENNIHAKLTTDLQKINVNVKRIYGDTEPEMFKKFNVHLVPTCVIDVNGTTATLEAPITFDNIKKQIDKMLTPIR